MNLVDSSGWLEYFADGPNADFFARPIETIRDLVVPTICLLEVFRRMMQQRGEETALQAVAAMLQGRIVDLDVTTALRAGKLGVELRLPMADGIVLATTRSHDAILWTQDADFKGLEGVRYREKAK